MLYGNPCRGTGYGSISDFDACGLTIGDQTIRSGVVSTVDCDRGTTFGEHGCGTSYDASCSCDNCDGASILDCDCSCSGDTSDLADAEIQSDVLVVNSHILAHILQE